MVRNMFRIKVLWFQDDLKGVFKIFNKVILFKISTTFIIVLEN